MNPNFHQMFNSFLNYVDLTEHQFLLFEKVFEERNFKKNDLLLNSGSVWEDIYFVKEGTIRLFYNTEDGREFNKGFFYENQFMWPVVPDVRIKPSLFAISAITNTKTLVCKFPLFFNLLKDMGKWDRFARIHAELLAEEKVARELNFLTSNAEKRYRMFLKNYGFLEKRIPDYHIASYLGITNVSLSRVKRRLVL